MAKNVFRPLTMTKHCNPFQIASHGHVQSHMTHTKISYGINFNSMLLPQLWPLIWPCFEKQDSRHYSSPKKCHACHDSNGVYLSVRFYFTWHKGVTASCLSCAHPSAAGRVRLSGYYTLPMRWIYLFERILSKPALPYPPRSYADSSRNLPRIAWQAQRLSELESHLLSASISRWPRFVGKLLLSSKSSSYVKRLTKRQAKLH